ncbi:ceramide kinase 1-like [Mercenaria mercenaria]|uniref:ceramide kinase 1-like n=1 Tax=Mercenaria mercenaria TaxID=6596 RepID=UPI00234E4D5D|nr:ceramide kinase 1-like [Mercenaria mercenaria]
MAVQVSPVLDGGKDVITSCICKIKSKNYSVSLTNGELTWHIAGNTQQKGLQTVSTLDILSVSLRSSTKQDSNSDSVCVSYVRQEKNFILKSCSVVFTAGDLQLIGNLHQQITDVVRNVGRKPKRLLVLINPVSGRSKGRTVYEQKVAPIFREAGIDTDVIVTEKAHHTEEILSTYDIKSINGLVLVGGDGLYHEAVNGLMRKLASEQGLNVDDPDETLPSIDLPMGLIPCGTGNGIAHACYGNYDVTTAALSIAIGYQYPANMMSVHSGNKLIAYSTLLAGYGTWGDLIYAAESRRSQGVLRYPIAMIEQMLIKAIRRFSLTIGYTNKEIPVKQNNTEVGIQAKDEMDNTDIAANMKETPDSTAQPDAPSNQSLHSATIKESVIGAIIFMLTPSEAFASTEEPDLSQSAMYLNKSSRRMKYISFLFQLMTLNFNAIERRDDITILPGKQWTLKLEDPSQPETENWELEHIMNIDGEIFRLPKPEYQAKLLSDRIKLFSNMQYATKREMKKK